MELQNAVKEALNALYHHPKDMVLVQADRWLQDFQRTIDAWQGENEDTESDTDDFDDEENDFEDDDEEFDYEENS